MPAKKRPVIYSVHPSVAYAKASIDGMKTKTGKSVDEWVAFIRKVGPATEVARRDWLKREHGLGTNHAGWLAARADGKGAEDGDADAYLEAAPGYVEAMYSGGKAALRPIHDALIQLALSLGREVKICPCQTMVPLFRNHVFAEIKPSTRTRIDLGLALRGAVEAKKKLPRRLIDTGGMAKKDRITHRFAITSLDEIDDLVAEWLRVAFDMDTT